MLTEKTKQQNNKEKKTHTHYKIWAEKKHKCKQKRQWKLNDLVERKSKNVMQQTVPFDLKWNDTLNPLKKLKNKIVLCICQEAIEVS